MEDVTNKKHIITIAGKPGSGKSSTSKAIAAELGYQHFSSGDLFRAISRDMGVHILQANLAAEKDEKSDIDSIVDQRLRDIGNSEDFIVIDSRMAWHWMPRSFKIYLDIDLLHASQRILQNIDPERLEAEHIPTNPEDYAISLKDRLDSEMRRYEMLYGVNPAELSNYDLVIDTVENNLDTVVETIVTAYRKWLTDS